MTYTAPIEDMMFVLEELCGLDDITRLPAFADLDPETARAILQEAGKFAGEVLAPLNAAGDRAGLGFDQGRVTLPEGWAEAYHSMCEMGWNAPVARDCGGMGLPALVNSAVQEMFSGANTAFQLCSMLTQGAVEAIDLYASQAQKALYLPKLVSGQWSGTMNLTEPQAGSDLGAIRTRAVPEGDHYRVSGQKIFITYGAHDMTENIIHLVLARLPDAPAGTKGISMFIVPKRLVNADGTLGAANDLRCVSLEHKMGIHASPTATMSFGDAGGAIGYLVGAPNQGLHYMFAMMNNARLGVGLQGVGIAEHATQGAVAFALERRQGRVPQGASSTAIISHPDIRRMLGLMRARTEAARVLAYRAARSLDLARHSDDARQQHWHQQRVDLLIPVVKAWSTELSLSTASLGVQVHGGMGYIEETGAAQHLRDARITSIYEGTTGIQALDLVGRKIALDKGAAAFALVADMRASAARLEQAGLEWANPERAAPDGPDWARLAAQVNEAAALVEEVTQWIIGQNGQEPQASACAVLELFGLCLGAWAMGDAAYHAAKRLAAGRQTAHARAKLAMADFYMAQCFPMARALRRMVEDGAASILALEPEDFAIGA
ncbi:acyl-CoA dehydrogenase (plasmid) [Thioclava litoralis]|uniref:Acyl-CoA dehydrogenase n=1 Tax=Thioclava litoralis TaxID=3076557 RepID=A0ABZ1E4G6_9RHOB|nr:acyl-CoA dehydrogenase [Thioclava sp. FTW29]